MEQKERDLSSVFFPRSPKSRMKGCAIRVIQAWLHAWKPEQFFRGSKMSTSLSRRGNALLTPMSIIPTRYAGPCEAIAAMALEGLNLKLHMDNLAGGAILHDVDK